METPETDQTRPADQPSRRERRRGRRGRRAALTIAAATALIGAFPVVDAKPASASGCGGFFGWFWDTTGDCYSDEYIWELIGGVFLYPPPDMFVPIATPTVPLSQKAGDALMKAEEAITGELGKDCERLITKGPIDQGAQFYYATAKEVLDSRKNT